MFCRDVKKLKNKPNILNRCYATDLLQEPSPFSYV